MLLSVLRASNSGDMENKISTVKCGPTAAVILVEPSRFFLNPDGDSE